MRIIFFMLFRYLSRICIFYQFRQPKDLLHQFVKKLLTACVEEAFRTYLDLKHICQESVEENVRISDQATDIEKKRAKLSQFLETALRYRRIPEKVELYGNGIEREECWSEADCREAWRVGDPYPSISPGEIREVTGRMDLNGMPVGRCEVSLRSGDQMAGVWRRGRREGLGSVTGPSLEERGIRSIRGRAGMICCSSSLLFRILPGRPVGRAGPCQDDGRLRDGYVLCPQPGGGAGGQQVHQDGELAGQ